MEVLADGEAVDLTNASAVTFIAKKGGVSIGTLTGTIENAASGIVRLDWPASPALTAGDWAVQVKIDWGSSVYQYVPDRRFLHLYVKPV
jgi:hypothetical protein